MSKITRFVIRGIRLTAILALAYPSLAFAICPTGPKNDVWASLAEILFIAAVLLLFGAIVYVITAFVINKISKAKVVAMHVVWWFLIPGVLAFLTTVLIFAIDPPSSCA